MNVSEMLSYIDNSGFSELPTTEKENAINFAIWDIESREQWPFLEKSTTLNFDGSNPNPTNMPADFKSVIWLYDLQNGVSLWPERLGVIRDRFGKDINKQGDPVYYYFLGNELRLYPMPPSSTGRFRLDYYATQPKVNSNTPEASILIPPRHHEVIILGALWRLWKREDDPEQGFLFHQDYENRIQLMTNDLIRRQYQQPDRIYMLSDDNDDYSSNWW